MDVSARATGVSADGLFVCETDPVSGDCLAPAATSVTSAVGAGGTPTFSVFVAEAETVPFDPAGTRVILDFVDQSGGAVRGSTSVALKSATAADWYSSNISEAIVQSTCVNCHTDTGVARNARLIFEVAPNPGYEAANLAAFETFVSEVTDAAELILNRVQGVGHGGGVQIPNGTAEFDDLAAFLELLGEEVNQGAIDPTLLFQTSTMLGDDATLTRAALLLTGAFPDAAARATLSSDGLRAALRSLMRGPGFHAFLLEGANDRLLTDREIGQAINPQRPFLVELANTNHFMLVDALATGNYLPWQRWRSRVQYGFARAPLELIAHVVQNDLPYTEILIADYVMANSEAAAAYGANTQFDDPDDPHEFKPSSIERYFRIGPSMEVEYELQTGTHVVEPGALSTDIPHAGVLNTAAFLKRYPSTATNRNRARARWTYYHFLDVDIERSAPRTTDPEALADQNNPTMNNPACTVCHATMDPVAGAFQNYGDEGFYRNRYWGLDSLDPFYKNPPGGGATPYVFGDTWYRDMREPGIDGLFAPDSSNSVQWLARHIAEDSRFPRATVKFWWPAIMGAEPERPPEESGDADFAGKLLAANAQDLEIDALASGFAAGFEGGAAFDLKDLLVEMLMSEWFRLDSVADNHPDRLIALADAGSERLLSPEQLSRKLESSTGFSWGRTPVRFLDVSVGNLQREYRLFYGGIDSDGVTERSPDMTAVMSGVAQAQAMESACPIVQRDLFLLADGQRHLLNGVSVGSAPTESAVRAKLVEMFGQLFGEAPGANDAEITRAYELFTAVRARLADAGGGQFPGNQVPCAWWSDFHYFDGLLDDAYTMLPTGQPRWNQSAVSSYLRTQDFSDPHFVGRTWLVVLGYLLTDYRFLYL